MSCHPCETPDSVGRQSSHTTTSASGPLTPSSGQKEQRGRGFFASDNSETSSRTSGGNRHTFGQETAIAIPHPIRSWDLTFQKLCRPANGTWDRRWHTQPQQLPRASQASSSKNIHHPIHQYTFSLYLGYSKVVGPRRLPLAQSTASSGTGRQTVQAAPPSNYLPSHHMHLTQPILGGSPHSSL